MRGKGRDPAMGSEKNGQLCRKCGKVCRIRCTLGKLGGILILYSGISKSARKSGGNDMRKWKSCLLLAVGMSAALSTAAMASQDKSDMVTVEVKECKGGAVMRRMMSMMKMAEFSTL